MKNWDLTRSRILAVPVPADTESYTAIPHRVFLEEIEEKLQQKGMYIQSEQFIGTKDYEVISGKFILRQDGQVFQEIAPSLFFGNSYNKKKKATIRAGAAVLVCKNGMMGTVEHGSYSRKHSGTALEDFRFQIDSILESLDKEFKRMEINMEEMKQIELDKSIRATLIGDMYTYENLITSTQLSILKKELSFSEHFKGTTLWDFYNNCTESFKDNHPMLHDNQHVKFHTYIGDKFNLTGSRGLYGGALEVPEAIILDETESAMAD